MAVDYVASMDEQAYVRKRVREANQIIRHYPAIQSFTTDLRALVNRRPHTIHNALLWRAASADNEFLGNLERALRVFKAKKWPRDLRNELRARLCSPASGECLSVVNELDAALTLRSLTSNVCLYPNYPRKGPDIRAELRSRPIFFELTSVGMGKTEAKLLKICRGIGKALHRWHGTRSILRVDIDSARLAWNKKGHILVKRSIQKTMTFAKMTQLTRIFDVFKNFHVLDATSVGGQNESARIKELIQTHPNERGFRSRRFKTYFRSASPAFVDAGPIRSFWRIKSRIKLTSVDSEMIWPSLAGTRERSAFLDRLERGLLKKIRYGQLQAGSPNVIGIRVSDWTFPNYEHASPLDFDWEFKSLKDRIRTVVNASRSPELSAVMFFEDRFQNAWVVGNRFAENASKLTNSEYIALYGKHRMSIVRKAKIAQRVRKRIIPAKLTIAANSIKRGYERTSKVKRISPWRMFNNSTDAHLKFVDLTYRFWIPRIWLRDPCRYPDFSETGRIVALLEEKFFVEQLLKNSTTQDLARLDCEVLVNIIEDFRTDSGQPDHIMIPMPLYFSHVSRWMREQIDCIRIADHQTYIRLPDRSEIPIHWLTKGLPQENIIVYKRSHGEWIFKPGNFAGVLSFEIRRNVVKDRLTLVAGTMAAYVIQDSSRARRFDISSVKVP